MPKGTTIKRFALRFLIVTGILIVTIVAVYFIFFSRKYPPAQLKHAFSIGDAIDSLNGVYVYNNGMDYVNSHGKNYSSDGVYYGQKWQCVEFIKRYYHQHYHFVFPDGMGNAKSFFDPYTPQGGINKRRGLQQFCNGGSEPVKPGDILVFDGSFGHVGIVSNVSANEVEIVQQNIFLQPRGHFSLDRSGGKFLVGTSWKPLGWLRLKQMQ